MIAIDLRSRYLSSLLKQEISYFEMNSVESMPSDIGQYFNSISLGIGESFAQILQGIGCIIGGLGISFWRGPVFTLICLVYLPIILINVVIMGAISKKAQFKKLEANKALGGYSEEQLANLKLVVAFAQEEKTVLDYDKKAAITRDIAAKANAKASFVFGVIRLLIFGFFAFSYYLASILLEKGALNPITGETYKVQEIIAVT
jgi:ABC-type multidrug transport system fused ATPase/permease subunit